MTRDEEIKFRIHVMPQVQMILETVGNDVAQFGVSKDEYIRAVWTWAVNEIMGDHRSAPPWIMAEMGRMHADASEARIINGEAG